MSRENPLGRISRKATSKLIYIQIQGLNISAEDADIYHFPPKFLLNANIVLRRRTIPHVHHLFKIIYNV